MTHASCSSTLWWVHSVVHPRRAPRGRRGRRDRSFALQSVAFRCIHQVPHLGVSTSPMESLLHRQAETLGNAPFLQTWSPERGIICTLSFGEFARRVKLAERVLLSHGVGDARVAFLAHPSAQYFIYCYAVINLGGVVVNLNWRQPKKSLVEMTTLSVSSVLVASTAFRDEAAQLLTDTALGELFWLPTAAPAGGFSPDHGFWLTALDTENVDEAQIPLRQPHNVAIDESSTAVIMFTSGSTSTPKAVPLTQYGLLWNCEQKRLMSPELVGAPHAGTLSFLPNFHVIGFTNNFLFNLHAGVRCAVLHDASTSPLSPRLILQACADLRPTVVDTVVWLAEEMLLLLDMGDAAAAPLKEVRYLLAGGAALNEELLLPILRKHGLALWPHYGQTELGGPATLGGLKGSLSAMRPPPCVQWGEQMKDLHVWGMHV